MELYFMLIQLLKSKIQELVVSESSTAYPGSISIPEELLKAAGIRPFELVYVNNKTNGNRITTYAVRSQRQGFVSVNGAAAKLFSAGDHIHVLSYAQFTEAEADGFQPTLVLASKNNRLAASQQYFFEMHPDEQSHL
jgi:aspartate 1-decarboxylase